ncbi:MAG: thermonuclease family protein [Alphaproteobacteria bacterium]|nr:thermonuclease family protein [Alphaproteobacteria bacterium]
MAALLSLAVVPAAQAADEIRGNAKITSGNELVIGKRKVWLYGIRAPALEKICKNNQAEFRCGIVAWAELIKLADGQFVSCDLEPAASRKEAAAEKTANSDKTATPDNPDPVIELPPNTVFATCYLGETDLNEALVRSGWAKAVPGHTDRYVVDETDARESLRGLWAAPTKKSKKKRRNKRR